MITEFSAKDYGCLKDVTIKLTPLHAFIGPNDSGKSTLLRAIYELCIGPFTGKDIPSLSGSDGESVPYHLTVGGRPSSMTGAAIFRLRPQRLRESSEIIATDRPVMFRSDEGAGMPGVYDSILGKEPERYLEIRSEIYRLFPHVKKMSLVASGGQGNKMFEFEVPGRGRLTLAEMSEGLAYYLAFASFPYLSKLSVLCVEEPENGLHPARIADVMRVLRKVSESGTQVLIATHSPLVINELRSEEVTVLTRTDAQGTVARPIAESPHFKLRSEVFSLGELWVSYCNGEDEAPLFSEEEPPL